MELLNEQQKRERIDKLLEEVQDRVAKTRWHNNHGGGKLTHKWYKRAMTALELAGEYLRELEEAEGAES